MKIQLFGLAIFIALLGQALAFAELLRGQYIEVSNDPNVIIVASTGRSGSNLLTMTLSNFAEGRRVMKTHCLPPMTPIKGKFFFIYSNPDLSAESALYRSLRSQQFGYEHFMNMETSDHSWLLSIDNDTRKQTLEHNLLAEDALGCAQHLTSWLYQDTQPCKPEEAQILAIKYEYLWEETTKNAIKEFLGLQRLQFPLKRERGRKFEGLSEIEKLMKLKYNMGTMLMPKYAAYDDARVLWEAAPPIQFLRFVTPYKNAPRIGALASERGEYNKKN